MSQFPPFIDPAFMAAVYTIFILVLIVIGLMTPLFMS